MTTFYIQNISMGKDSFEVLLNTLTRRFGERGCELCNAQDADYTFRLAKDPASSFMISYSLAIEFSDPTTQ